MKVVFQSPPENFNSKLAVVGCFIKSEGEFLFLKQQTWDTEANNWGIPGGKVEKDENPHEAVIREVKEETSLKLDFAPLFLGKVYIRYPEIDFDYMMYEVCLTNRPNIAIDSAEHTEFRWMSLEAALTLPLIRGEAECIRLVYPNEKNLTIYDK